MKGHYIYEEDNNWIQNSIEHPGSLRKRLHKKEDEEISISEIDSELAKLNKKHALTKDDIKFKKQLVLAKNLMKLKKEDKMITENLDDNISLISWIDSNREYIREANLCYPNDIIPNDSSICSYICINISNVLPEITVGFGDECYDYSSLLDMETEGVYKFIINIFNNPHSYSLGNYNETPVTQYLGDQEELTELTQAQQSQKVALQAQIKAHQDAITELQKQLQQIQ